MLIISRAIKKFTTVFNILLLHIKFYLFFFENKIQSLQVNVSDTVSVNIEGMWLCIWHSTVLERRYEQGLWPRWKPSVTFHNRSLHADCQGKYNHQTSEHTQTSTYFSLNKTKQNNLTTEYCLLPNLMSLNIMYSQHFSKSFYLLMTFSKPIKIT